MEVCETPAASNKAFGSRSTAMAPGVLPPPETVEPWRGRQADRVIEGLRGHARAHGNAGSGRHSVSPVVQRKRERSLGKDQISVGGLDGDQKWGGGGQRGRAGIGRADLKEVGAGGMRPPGNPASAKE